MPSQIVQNHLVGMLGGALPTKIFNPSEAAPLIKPIQKEKRLNMKMRTFCMTSILAVLSACNSEQPPGHQAPGPPEPSVIQPTTSPTMTPSPGAEPSLSPEPEPTQTESIISGFPSVDYISTSEKITSPLFFSQNKGQDLLVLNTGLSDRHYLQIIANSFLDHGTPESITSQRFPLSGVSYPDLIKGVVTSQGTGVFAIRDAQTSNQTIGPEPVQTKIISFQNNALISDTSLDLSVHDLEVDENGNGYILLSEDTMRHQAEQNEQPSHINIYTSEIKNFIPAPPRSTITLNVVPNPLGFQNVDFAHIDSMGSGFVIYHSEEEVFYFQKIDSLKKASNPIILFEGKGKSATFSYKGDPLSGFLYSFIGGEEDNLTVQSVENYLPEEAPYRFQIPVNTIQLNTQTGSYRYQNWDISLNDQGDGLIVIPEQKSNASLLQVLFVEHFKVEKRKEYTYAKGKVIIDSKLIIEENGSGKLIFTSGKCHNSEPVCASVNAEDTTEIGMVTLSDFTFK